MKIFYQRAYSIAPYLTERIGFEIDAPDECDPLEEIGTLKSLCDDAHKKLNPGLELEVNYSSIPGHPEYQKQQYPLESKAELTKQTAEQAMIESINGCSSIEVLNTFKLLVKNNPVFQSAYDKKLEQLQNQNHE